MPTRILRDWTDSATIENLSAESERLFVRLIMRADDFGRYHACPRLVAAGCLPLVRQVTVNLVSAWLSDLQKAGLITIYKSDDGRNYLQISKFGQRTRANHSKFPAPSPSSVRQVSDKCKTTDGHPRSESESESESETYSETEAESETGHPAPLREDLKHAKEFSEAARLVPAPHILDYETFLIVHRPYGLDPANTAEELQAMLKTEPANRWNQYGVARNLGYLLETISKRHKANGKKERPARRSNLPQE